MQNRGNNDNKQSNSVDGTACMYVRTYVPALVIEIVCCSMAS